MVKLVHCGSYSTERLYPVWSSGNNKRKANLYTSISKSVINLNITNVSNIYIYIYIYTHTHVFFNFLQTFLNQDFAVGFSSWFVMCLIFMNKNDHYHISIYVEIHIMNTINFYIQTRYLRNLNPSINVWNFHIFLPISFVWPTQMLLFIL